MPSLVVRPTSTILAYQSNEVDPLQAGRELGVDAVLAGEVARDGERLHVAVRLLAVEDGAELWTAQIEAGAEDLFATQDEVSRQVAAATGAGAAPDRGRAAARGPAGRAYDLYLQGKAHLLRETLSELVAAIDLFERSRAADASFAPAWAGSPTPTAAWRSTSNPKATGIAAPRRCASRRWRSTRRRRKGSTRARGCAGARRAAGTTRAPCATSAPPSARGRGSTRRTSGSAPCSTTSA